VLSEKREECGCPSEISDFSVVKWIFVAFLLVDQEFCCTFAVALFGNESEKAV
jgi:hypothetical protein